nr:helix-turn-helix domain-containing protein [Aeromicrobium sp. CFBP 8757]
MAPDSITVTRPMSAPPTERPVLPLPGWAIEAFAAHDISPMISRIVGESMGLAFADSRDDTAFVEALHRSVTENASTLKDVLCGEVGLGNLLLVHPLRFAELEAERRVPHASLQRSYRNSFAIQWDEWAGVLAEAAENADVSRLDALAAVVALTRTIGSYTEVVISSAALSFSRSEDAFKKSRAHVRQRLIREILDGSGEVLSPADLMTLDYSLGGHHLAVQLPEVPQVDSQRIVNALRTSVSPMHTIVYPVTLGSSVVWLGSSKPWSDDRMVRAVDLLGSMEVRASVSEQAAGLSGFLRAFEEVRSVEEIRASVDSGELPDVVRYRDLRLEILLMRDRQLAAEFVASELGPLAEHTSEASKLRATLEASFRLGSHVAAAEHLQLHEHTVRNRLQKAQDLLGPTQDRRTELQVALRLWRIMNVA